MTLSGCCTYAAYCVWCTSVFKKNRSNKVLKMYMLRAVVNRRRQERIQYDYSGVCAVKPDSGKFCK